MVKATPILRRHVLASSDYRVLSRRKKKKKKNKKKKKEQKKKKKIKKKKKKNFLIAAMKRGEPRFDFKVAAEAVGATGIAHPRVLEVGCGSGYYSEVFATLLPDGVQYAGADYSDAHYSTTETFLFSLQVR